MKKTLDRLHKKHSRASSLQFDPLFLLDRSLSPLDQEIIGFLLAGLAYGRVEQIQKSASSLLAIMEKAGCGPTGLDVHQKLLSPNFQNAFAQNIRGWKHRLNTETDLIQLFYILGQALKMHGSLKALMANSRASAVTETLISFSSALSAYSPKPEKQFRSKSKKWSGTGPSWFFASPQDGSSCKRLMLWLRWMVRKNDIDPGPWNSIKLVEMPISQSELLIPLDVHVFRWAQKEKVTQYKTPSWKAVIEISAHLRKIEPRDPLRYDFAIFQESFQEIRKGGRALSKESKLKTQSQ